MLGIINNKPQGICYPNGIKRVFKNKISYDYIILIREIQEELEEGVFSGSYSVHILRAPDPLPGLAYHPIVDWYNGRDTVRELAVPEFGDDEEDIADRKKMVRDYFRDFEHLEKIGVADLLAEMEE